MVVVEDREPVADLVVGSEVRQVVEVCVMVDLDSRRMSQVANLLQIVVVDMEETIGRGYIVAEGSMRVGIADQGGQRKEVDKEAVGKLPQVVCRALVKMIHNPHLVLRHSWLVEEEKGKHSEDS